MQEMKDKIINYIQRYKRLIDSGGMTVGGLHKLLLAEGVICSRNYVYLLYNQTKDDKTIPNKASKRKAPKGRKNL